MLIWTDQLQPLGFRRKSDRYWRCDRGYGLDGAAHLSLFLWTLHAGSQAGSGCFELCEFHATFEAVGHNLHFYYHEVRAGEWAGAGHTSHAEIRRLGLDPITLRREADAISGALVRALGGRLHERPGS